MKPLKIALVALLALTLTGCASAPVAPLVAPPAPAEDHDGTIAGWSTCGLIGMAAVYTELYNRVETDMPAECRTAKNEPLEHHR